MKNGIGSTYNFFMDNCCYTILPKLLGTDCEIIIITVYFKTGVSNWTVGCDFRIMRLQKGMSPSVLHCSQPIGECKNCQFLTPEL